MLARENALRPLRPCVKSIYNLFVHPGGTAVSPSPPVPQSPSPLVPAYILCCNRFL